MEETKRTLEELYAKLSKHGQYQTLPAALADKLGMQFEVNEEWRGDRTRYPVIRDHVQRTNAHSLLDIGANTGFFSLSLAGDIPGSRVTACELNKTHAQIISLLAKVAELDLTVIDHPADLANLATFPHSDLVLHLNILHHAGHDFDRHLVPGREHFSGYAAEYLASMRSITDHLIFQMGYNWGGDKTQPLVDRDDQAGKVLFTLDLFTRAGWIVESIAFARKGEGELPVEYDVFPLGDIELVRPRLQERLVSRYGTSVWSEFYQRPIWFCRAGKG